MRVAAAAGIAAGRYDQQWEPRLRKHPRMKDSTMHDPRDPIRQIETFRENRQSRQRDLTIRSLIEGTAASAKRSHRQLGAIIDLWEQLVPRQLADHATIAGLRGGTLHVTVDSSAIAYDLDRLLRGGLEQQIREQYRGTLLRVRVKVGMVDEHAE